MDVTKPYMLSLGVGFPLFGLWAHRYYHVRQPHSLRTINALGFRIIWTTYRRIDDVP